MVAFIDDHREEYGVEPIGYVPPVEYEETHYHREKTSEVLTTLN